MSSSVSHNPDMETTTLSHFLAISGVLGLVLLFITWRAMNRAGKKRRGRSAPEPAGAWPVLGHLPLLRGQTQIFRTLGAMADTHGPVFMIRLGLRRALVVSSREDVRECFTTNDKAFASRPRFSAGKLLGYNYAGFSFAPHGTLWRELRKLSIVEILSARRLDELTHVRVSELELSIRDLYSLGQGSNWVDPVKVVMCEWFQRLGLNTTLMMIAGKRYSDNPGHRNEEARRAVAASQKLLSLSGAFVPSDVIPGIEWMDLQGYLGSMKRVAKELDWLVGGWIKEHEKRLKKGSSRHDFIDVMLSVLEETSIFGHSRETIIKATVMTLMAGGTDTVSLTSTWLLSALLNDKHALKRAQEELDLQVGRGRWVEQSDIPNLQYLRAIIKETFRLYAAVPLMPAHESMDDCQVAGYHIPKGTLLLVNAWKLHRDPTIWPNPEEFQPERFLTSHADVDVFGQHFELIPFGSGRRSCPGITMALQFVSLAIARLLQGFDLSTPLNAPVDMGEGQSLTLAKLTPLEVVLTPRLPSQFY